MYEDPKSKIGQLEKILDAREDRVSGKTRRHNLQPQDVFVKPGWDDDEFKQTESDLLDDNTFLTQPKKSTLALKIFWGSVIFFILALLIAAFRFIGGGNIVSGDNIAVTVKAPTSVAGGEVVSFEVEVQNNNNVSLLGADLGIVFPAGARQTENTSLPAKRVQDFLGTIESGKSIKKNYNIVLFGSENEQKDITLTLAYKVSGSNSQFNKTKTVSVLISSAPISIVVTGAKEINTNQIVDLTVELTSNSPTVMKGLLLKAEYPFGFTFNESNPQTYSKNNLWLIGDLAPGAKRTVRLTGMITGQEGEERGFNFSIGPQAKVDNLTIESVLSTAFSTVTVRRPFVSADIFLNNTNSPEYVATAGSDIQAVIKWQNNLSYQVSDVSLIVKLDGNAVDKSSIQTTGGYYRSLDNTIIFSKATDAKFANLKPGETGESKFSFRSFSLGSVTGGNLSNPLITVNASVKGQRSDFGSDPEDVLFSDSRRIKITANPNLFAKALYFIGPFQNTGALPPKAEKETTYTVTWTITNPLNNLSGVKAKVTLPPYIKWLSQITPVTENMSYTADTGELVWLVGNVTAGSGLITPAREVSFQISFLPSVGQIGTTPTLLNSVVLEGRDTFTATTVTDDFPSMTINLTSDPYFKLGDDRVVK